MNEDEKILEKAIFKELWERWGKYSSDIAPFVEKIVEISNEYWDNSDYTFPYTGGRKDFFRAEMLKTELDTLIHNFIFEITDPQEESDEKKTIGYRKIKKELLQKLQLFFKKNQ